MYLRSLRIQGFRKHYDTTIVFSDSTFLIGENNVGKSSILYALDYLLNGKKVNQNEYFSCITTEGENKRIADDIILTAEFCDLPTEARLWRGFKGRVIPSINKVAGETGLSFIYRKTFSIGASSAKIETKEFKKEIKPNYRDCKTVQDYLDNGLDEGNLSDEINQLDRDKKLTNKQKRMFDSVDEIFDFDETEEVWVENPGGIPQNVLSKLPKYLLIPAQDREDEITGSSGTLQKTLNELFSEIRESSENYKKAQEYLDKLSQELNPEDTSTEISKMIVELNNIVSEIFPGTGITTLANLSDADSVIKPTFRIEMNSNITTPANLQGTGLIRSTVFALLRYKSLRDNRKNNSETRPLIIGFEEPEIYLHPNAISKMRDTIYNLAENADNQIVCTTHSPYMIDISKKPSQVLNSLWTTIRDDISEDGKAELVESMPFNVTDEFIKLQGDSKNYIKMILKIDESIARCFFVKKVLIVEGDTEQVVLTETINRMPHSLKNQIFSDWHIVRARGKAAIIPLVKYLKAMTIDVYVIHDGDFGVNGAECFNKPIREALSDDSKLVVLENCIEDVLGYNAPKTDKPFVAYKHIQDNWTD
ncbi:AAA family ATPase [Ruminococcus bovis]|uniref:AAA family ATPase n=1 Tax=Ruminococcus bovis TaxID=2564099 RepID=UPI001A9ABDFD|nr:ATP-dependent endonuclease [Ruminococcus bovis]